jgi:hypothetical protein
LEQRATGELSTAKPIGAARRLVKNLLEQRAGWSKTYWSSAQVGQKPIGAARRLVKNLLEQRAGEAKYIGAARRPFLQLFDF